MLIKYLIILIYPQPELCIKKGCGGEMAQWLSALGTLEEDQDLVSSAQVITSCNSNSRNSDTLFQPPWAPVCM